jgi:hypothetical protein
MPAHRTPSITRSHTRGPYKLPIIVISSDEDDDPRPSPQRGSRKPRRSKPQEVLEVLDDPPVKHEETETETENLRRLCHELEQASSSRDAWIPIKGDPFQTPRSVTCCKRTIDGCRLLLTS